jgi:chemotaxis protein CheD
VSPETDRRRPGGAQIAVGQRVEHPATGIAPRFTRVGGSRTLVVGIADCRVATDPRQILLTYALGSCVGITIWNRKSRTGSLLHAMLPDSSLDAARAEQNPYVFVDTGLATVIADMKDAADASSDLVVKLAGGASLLDSSRRFQVGDKNVAAVREAVAAAGLSIDAEDTGGSGSRTMIMQLLTGQVSLRRGAEEIGIL